MTAELHAIDGGRAGDESPVTGADGFHLTDVGNAQRLIAQHGHDLRYIHTWHRWLVYDGKRWRLDDTGEAVRRTVETIRDLTRYAATVEDAQARQRLLKHALGSERDARVRAALSLAESLAPILHEELDADPFLLNVENGTIDLRTGDIWPHQANQLISKLAPVVYDRKAKAPTWDRFLERVLPDPAVRAFVQAAIGYSLTGDTGEQVLFMLYGAGANGKTTFLETIRAMLGDYGQQAPAETFLERRGSIPNDVARLRGARFVAATETGEGRRLNEVLVKRMTGGDSIPARFMRSEWFEFRPQFKAWLATNHKPDVRGTDEAIWRRFRLIPFTVTIPEADRDPKLPEKLRAELPGILAQAVAACLDWQEHGLPKADAVTAATQEYRSDNDVIGRFLDDCCALHADATARAGDLYASYGYWCTANGEQPLSQRAFGLRLHERGYTQQRTKSARMWLGLGLRAVTSEGDG